MTFTLCNFDKMTSICENIQFWREKIKKSKRLLSIIDISTVSET